MRRYAIFSLFLILLAGCATNYSSPKFYVDRVTQMQLPEYRCIKPFNKLQLLDFSYADKSDHLIVQLSCSNDKLTLTGLLPIGARLFTISRSQNCITAESFTTLPNQLSAEQVLGDVLLSIAKTKEISAVLPPGYSVKKLGETQRIIVNPKGDAIKIIIYSADTEPLSIEDRVFHYQLNIKNLRQ